MSKNKTESLQNGDVVSIKCVVKRSRGVMRLKIGNASVPLEEADVIDVLSQKLGRGDVVGVIDPANRNAKPESGTIRAALDNGDYTVRRDSDGESVTVSGDLLRRLED